MTTPDHSTFGGCVDATTPNIMPLVSVIIPTIDGREHYLRKALDAYDRTTEDWELILERGHPTCSLGWNAGVKKAKGDYIHFSSDDVEPEDGWWEAAIACCETGRLPCADLLDSDGVLSHCGDSGEERLQIFSDGDPSAIMRMPFFPAHLTDSLMPVMQNHYMSDYHIAWKAERAGWPVVVVRRYLFTHHHALEGRLYTIDQDVIDYHRIINGG